MKLKELRQKKEEDLQKMLLQHRDKLRELRFNIANRKLRDVKQVKKTKKTVARILTLLKESTLNSKSKV